RLLPAPGRSGFGHCQGGKLSPEKAFDGYLVRLPPADESSSPRLQALRTIKHRSRRSGSRGSRDVTAHFSPATRRLKNEAHDARTARLHVPEFQPDALSILREQPLSAA